MLVCVFEREQIPNPVLPQICNSFESQCDLLFPYLLKILQVYATNKKPFIMEVVFLLLLHVWQSCCVCAYGCLILDVWDVQNEKKTERGRREGGEAFWILKPVFLHWCTEGRTSICICNDKVEGTHQWWGYNTFPCNVKFECVGNNSFCSTLVVVHM